MQATPPSGSPPSAPTAVRVSGAPATRSRPAQPSNLQEDTVSLSSTSDNEDRAGFLPRMKTAMANLINYSPNSSTPDPEWDNVEQWSREGFPFASNTPILRERGDSNTTDQDLENMERWTAEVFPSRSTTPILGQMADPLAAFFTPISQITPENDLSTTEQLNKLGQYHREGIRAMRRLSFSSVDEEPEGRCQKITQLSAALYNGLRSLLPCKKKQD